MKLFSNNIVPYASTEGDKIYPIIVDIKKGIKSGEAISFVTADNQVGVIAVDFMDGNSSYSIEGCMVTSTIRRPDGTVLEIPCDIISQSTIEIPLGINGTYQEGVHTFDLKIVRGNGKVIGVPTMSYSVSGSLSSDDVVEGDDRLPVLTMMLDNAQDKLTRLDKAIAGATNDLEVKEARDGEVTLNARLERDLAKGKIHFVDVKGSSIATESQEGYLENVEIYGNTYQDTNNLSDIRSVGTKVEGQELYEIPVLSCGKNLFDGKLKMGYIDTKTGVEGSSSNMKMSFDYIRVKPNTKYALYFHSGEDYANVFTYDKDKNFISYKGFRESFTTESNAYYIRFYNTCNNDLEANVQLEEGTQATPYEPYQEHKLTILSPTPLEKVGGVVDRIICKGDVWGIEKNIKTVVFDGTIVNGNVSSSFPSDNSSMFYILSTDVVNDSPVICDKFPHKNISNTSNRNVEGVFVSVNGSSNAFYFRIFNDKLSTQNVAGFKQWLSENNITIKYKTVNPTFIPLPNSQQIKLRTFADRTNIHFETEIQPTLKAQVPKSLGATVNTHTTQIDNLNKELDRVKKLEESTVSTVTTDKAFTTITETTQGYFEDMKVEGKSLVNLLDLDGDWFDKETTYKTDSTVNVGLGYCPKSFSLDNVVSNSVYTVIPFVDYTTISQGTSLYIQLNCLVNEASGNLFKINYTSFNKPTLITTKTVDTTKNKSLFMGGTAGEYKFRSCKILILEGDHTDKDISYFEGLKSVGQDTDGIEILSQNNNLFDGVWNDGTVDADDGEDKYDTVECKTGYVYIGNCARLYKKEFADTNLPYAHYKTRFFDKNKKYIGLTDTWKTSSESYTVPNGAVYMRLIPYETNREVMSNVRLIVSKSEITDYIEPKMNKNQILYYNPTTQVWEKPVLREWDSIEKHSDGKYYYRKRSGEVVLNGSESESWLDFSPQTTNVFKSKIKIIGAMANASIICDKVKYEPNLSTSSKDFEFCTLDGNKDFVLSISTSKANTKELFKTWLQSNNVTVVYQLAQEEVYECTNLDLITYPNETNLIVNSGAIQPKLTLKVLSNVSNVVKLLQEKVSMLENKFIKGLQQVLAGDMMSLAHLLYPEDFEH